MSASEQSTSKWRWAGVTFRSTRASARSNDGDQAIAEIPLVSEPKDQADEIPKKLPLKLRLLGLVIGIVLRWTYLENGSVRRSIIKVYDPDIPASSKPVDGIYSKDVVINSGINGWVRIYSPQEPETGDQSRKLPVFIYFHGGGFASGSPGSAPYVELCRRIAKACHAVVISAHYRWAPEFRYPVQYEDCFAVLRWLKSSEATKALPLRADISQCFLAGDSAGGNIAHFMGCKAIEEDLDPINIRGTILVQPFFGGEERTHAEKTLKNPILLSVELADWFWKSFLPVGADRDHFACNIFGPNAPDVSRLSKLPPTFISIGSHDILKDWQSRYAKTLREIIGEKSVTVKTYSEAVHGFFGLDALLLEVLIADISEFVQGLLLKPDSCMSSRSAGAL